MKRTTKASRRGGRALAGAAAVGLALLATACSGNGAAALGHSSCLDVARALNLYREAQRSADPAVQRRDETASLVDLREALRPAALAAGEDTDWQALEATLSETSRVPEADLIEALQSQCAATLS